MEETVADAVTVTMALILAVVEAAGIATKAVAAGGVFMEAMAVAETVA